MRMKMAIWTATSIIAVACAALVVRGLRSRSRSIEGVTLIQDPDVRRQVAIAGVDITVALGGKVMHATSDGNGAFKLILPPRLWRNETAELRFRHDGYQPLTISQSLRDRICVIRMSAVRSKSSAEPAGPEISLKDVRVRYASKAATPIDVGSVAKTFKIVNAGDVPCERAKICSPDRRWKAAIGGVTLDAGEGHEFRTLRTSCIAGPCPFTRIESNQQLQGGQIIKVVVRDWSDTVTFLVEAEVIQTRSTDVIRDAYPAIFGREMSFSLPPTAQGPSIEADTNGVDIVYPLGPELALSWAVCRLQLGVDQTKLYRCELKPGYRFQ